MNKIKSVVYFFIICLLKGDFIVNFLNRTRKIALHVLFLPK